MKNMPLLVKIDEITAEQLASICDHTFLMTSEAYRHKAAKGESAIRLREKYFEAFLNGAAALKCRPYSLCVRAEVLEQARIFLDANGMQGVKLASVVCFPDGHLYPTMQKVAETNCAISRGADEIDMVLNYERLKKGHIDYAKEDIALVVDAAHRHHTPLKVILENSELNNGEIALACRIADEAGADFVKTSTGFGAYGAREEGLRIMKANFPRGIKISGGVTADNYRALLKAASGREDGMIRLDPMMIRIGESGLLSALSSY